MKKIKVTLEDELWDRVRDAAERNRVSMDAFILEVLSTAVRKSDESTGQRRANFAEAIGPAPQSWTWNRIEIYEDAIEDQSR